ncbi:MAG TPA: hypothetical protein VH740_03470 [Vicinamibacterales bacterium]|jgi:hypothetical protein
MDILRQVGIFALLTLAIDFVPLGMAVVYLLKPTERNLALMRPFSLAGLFAALAGGVLGFLHVLTGIAVTPDLSPSSYGRIAAGSAESLVTMFVGFACLSAAWLLVAVGMSRTRAEV